MSKNWSNEKRQFIAQILEILRNPNSVSAEFASEMALSKALTKAALKGRARKNNYPRDLTAKLKQYAGILGENIDRQTPVATVKLYDCTYKLYPNYAALRVLYQNFCRKSNSFYAAPKVKRSRAA